MLVKVSLLVVIHACAASAGNLLILDAGVGHRSTPIPQWQPSLRRVATNGTNATIIQQLGPIPESGTPIEPILASSLAYSLYTQSAFLVTGQGIVRADIIGNSSEIIISGQDEDPWQIVSVTIAEKEKKLYYSTLYGGLIKKADLDGGRVETVKNVSQGINYSFVPSFTPANSYADGLLVDEEKGWLYWSATRGSDDGSIRRTPIHPQSGEEQLIASGLSMPGQLRLVRDVRTRTNALWWTEKGRWNTSPTALKLVDLSKLSEVPASASVQLSTPVPILTMIQSNDSSIFFERDYTGEQQTLSIRSFVIFRDGFTQKVWFVVQSSGRTMFSKLIEANWRGSGDGRKVMLNVLNQNTKDLGVPVGLEYTS